MHPFQLSPKKSTAYKFSVRYEFSNYKTNIFGNFFIFSLDISFFNFKEYLFKNA